MGAGYPPAREFTRNRPQIFLFLMFVAVCFVVLYGLRVYDGSARVVVEE